MQLSDGGVLLNILDNVVNGGERHRNAGVSAAVVDSNSAGILVAESSAGEGNVLNVANALVDLLRADEVFSTSVLYLPRFVDVEDAGGEAVNKAVAALENAVVEAEPALRSLYRDRACAYLLGLPSLEGAHNVSVLAPVLHIRRLRDVHIAERSMAAVGRTREHQILVVYLSGEHNAVSVERQECVFALIEGLEVKGVANADGGLPAVSVAPGHPISVLDPGNAGVVAVAPLIYLFGRLVSLYELDSFRIYLPVDTVLREACVQLHVSDLIVYTENACELALERNNSAVEDRVGSGEKISGDNGVSIVSPYYIVAALGLVLPGHIRN